jgi:hypothetical protein
MMYAVAEDATFAWRQHGDAWDEDDESDDEEGEGVEGMHGGTVAAAEDGGLAVPDAAEFMDGLLMSLLAKHGSKMASLPYLQQGFVASVVAQAKVRLTASLEEVLKAKRDAGEPPLVSKQDMDALLASVGSELQAIKTAAAQELSFAP